MALRSSFQFPSPFSMPTYLPPPRWTLSSVIGRGSNVRFSPLASKWPRVRSTKGCGVLKEVTVSGFADYEQYDALGLADLVRRKEVSPEDLLDAAIERVAARN